LHDSPDHPAERAFAPGEAGGNVTEGSGASATLGGHAYKIPARLCYEVSAPDTAYVVDASGLRPILFDPAVCYVLAALRHAVLPTPASHGTRPAPDAHGTRPDPTPHGLLP